MPDTTTQTTAVRIERTYQASADVLFDAWTNPEVIRKWWHAGPDWDTADAEIHLGLLHIRYSCRVLLSPIEVDVAHLRFANIARYGCGRTPVTLQPTCRRP
ncbi:hypothetical protein GCM10022226_45950 [Sphaerisporangium flaviroseum]|uniref:Activator of HSP90 ATPase n=1 Tax=Sphaerisporangium flaviroseum TaxID=509199 RepID=A0ABP7IK33_9ACTN